MFLWWVLVTLILQHAQGVDQSWAGLTRFNDIIDIAQFSRNKWVGKMFAVFIYELYFSGDSDLPLRLIPYDI